jgi:hypothetical protein
MNTNGKRACRRTEPEIMHWRHYRVRQALSFPGAGIGFNPDKLSTGKSESDQVFADTPIGGGQCGYWERPRKCWTRSVEGLRLGRRLDPSMGPGV